MESSILTLAMFPTKNPISLGSKLPAVEPIVNPQLLGVTEPIEKMYTELNIICV